jgi:rubrerythrin
MTIQSADRGPNAAPLSQFRCSDCSYGASRRIAPERCPICGASTWEFEPWRPFTNLATDLAPPRN